jgi:hypothetical protein
MPTTPPLTDLLKPTRLKLRVLSLAIAAIALYGLAQRDPQDVALLSACLIGFALSPLSVRREVLYDVEHIVVKEPRAHKTAQRAEIVEDEVDAIDERELATTLLKNNPKLVNKDLALVIARRMIADGSVMSQNGKILASQ